MKNPSKESLEKLLRLIDELCACEENQWFKEALSSKFGGKNGFENFPAFLKHQKNQFKIKGRSFYAAIADEKLKKELVDDYIEMSWYQSVNNLNRFMLYVFYQMENLLNYYISISNAFEKIDTNKNYYIHKYPPKFTVIVYDSFFYKNEEKSIKDISIWSKLTFWMIDSNNKDWEKMNHRNINNLISTRNAISHRNSNSNNKYVDDTIDALKKSDFSSLSFYFNVLKKILETYNYVNPEVVKYDVKMERQKVTGPKQVGFIEPSKFSK